MAEVIKVEHIEKSFKKHKVLKDVSLTCESGKIGPMSRFSTS